SAERDYPASTKHSKTTHLQTRCADAGRNGGRRMSEDFSNPGDTGEALPDGFKPWQWGLNYTVHPELISPLKCGREYRITVSALRKVVNLQDPGYAALYERATTITKGRAARLTSADQDAGLHTRILAHGWFTHANTHLARVFVTLGAVYLKKGDIAPQGELT